MEPYLIRSTVETEQGNTQTLGRQKCQSKQLYI